MHSPAAPDSNDPAPPSRRSLLLAATTAIPLLHGAAQATGLTAGIIIDRIKTNVGIPWRQQTVDNLIAGTLDTPVTGIATTMMATLHVCKRAQAAGKNMVITHESTFFSHQDTTAQLQEDETYLCKRDFLAQHQMAVFHFHDHWHARQPDGIAEGMIRTLGWEKYTDAGDIKSLTFPATPLAQFAQHITAKLGIRTARVVGDPQLPVKRAVTSWGYVGAGIPLISREGVDLLICGETREWELVEYVQDMISCGKHKALILLGHVVSEQAGMRLCADWLRPLLPEVPVEFIAAPEPFWSPGHPPGRR